VDSPVIALEISRDEGDIEAVLHRTDATKDDAARKRASEAAKTETRANSIDLLFIPIYAFCIWSFARLFTVRTRLLTLAILATALFDYLEDWRIYQALAGQNPQIFIPSLVKWGLLGLVLISVSVILVRSASPVYAFSTKRLMAIGYFASGALALLDVAFGEWIGYSHIAVGVGVFGVLVLANVVGLLGPYLTIPGLQQTYVENFCERRKKETNGSLTAVRGERTN
jgi:hypothetical protein